MEFSINKNATLPILKMELVNDGRNDFSEFHEKIQNADITFTMTDVVTGVKRIAKKPTNIEQILPETCVGPEFYVVYQFTEKDTNQAGRFVGQFIIDFLDDSGKLIVPIVEELFINIIDGSIKK